MRAEAAGDGPERRGRLAIGREVRVAVDEHGFGSAELDAGEETVARRLRALQGGLRALERTRLRDLSTDDTVVDLNAAEAGAPPLALPVASDGLTSSPEPATPAPIPDPAPFEPSRPPVSVFDPPATKPRARTP